MRSRPQAQGQTGLQRSWWPLWTAERLCLETVNKYLPTEYGRHQDASQRAGSWSQVLCTVEIALVDSRKFWKWSEVQQVREVGALRQNE